VPDDVAVVGFDDSIIALSTQPALSSVHQSMAVMGRELVSVLLQTLDSRDDVFRRVVLETELIVRQSSGGVPTGKN
jgi:DNA-binding LacI/PurR family transcriptional regulator